MAKDFKKEYSKHIESETPDLWSRIESGLTDKTPSKVASIEEKKARKTSKIYTWKKAMPAVAAVVLLLVAAPLIAPRVMEKSADMAMFDTKANTESLKYEMAMDSVMEEDKMALDVAETVEEAAPETGEIASYDADNGVVDATKAGAAGATTPPMTNANTEMEQTKEDTGVEIIVLHFLVVDKVQDMNLLAIYKEHIGPVWDSYLIEVDGKEKVLGIPYAEEETELEIGVWYDLTVTDSTEYGMDYIWVK